MSCYQNSGQITDAASNGAWDVTFLPQDAERETKMGFGPIYEVADATYIVKAGSPITNFATLDQPGVKVAAVNNTTTMRGASCASEKCEGHGYQTYRRDLCLAEERRDRCLRAVTRPAQRDGQKIPGTKVLDETFKKTVTAVAVPLGHPQALAFVTKFMTEAMTNGTLRKAYDNNGLKDTPIRTE